VPQGYNQTVESPTQERTYTGAKQFIATLGKALRGDLPGLSAQLKMAPIGRQSLPGPTDHPRHSAVLALFHTSSDGLALVFTLRQATLRHHGGQISFPGGGVEPQDATYEDTALRETEEELGIPAEVIETVGTLTPLFIAPSQNLVTPVVGWVQDLPPLHPNPLEVSDVLTVSLSHLLTPSTRGSYTWHRNGQTLIAPCYKAGSNSIWGATAMMLSELIEVVRSL
jgi:8-oxo-dGTP pyrophosphatase MutT (NUDIX family)